MDDLNDFFYFSQVVDQGGFASAGRALGIPKSRLSRRIAGLEQRLGARLLHRTTRRLHVTELGEQFLQHCHAMLVEAQAARSVIDEARSEPRGTLRVSCPLSIAQHMLAPLLPRFLLTYPKVRLWLEITGRRVDVIQDGFDIAIRVRATLEDSSLAMRSFGKHSAMLVASPEFLNQHGRPRTVDDLSRLDSVDLIRQDGRHVLSITDPKGAMHQITLQPRLVVDDMTVLYETVLGGAAMAVLPLYMCQAALHEGKLETIPTGWKMPIFTLHAVFPSRRGLLPSVRAFLDYLSLNLPGEPDDTTTPP